MVSALSVRPAVTRRRVASCALLLTVLLGGNSCGGDAPTAPTQNPIPRISSLSQDSALAGEAGVTLALEGSGFVAASTVQWNGADRPTTFVSGSRLEAEITSGDLAGAGTASVRVSTPPPGGGFSNTVAFTILAVNPKPVVTAVTERPGTTGLTSVVVNGSGFIPGSVIRWNGADQQTEYIDDGALRAEISFQLAILENVEVVVYNPPPGGGTSMPFVVRLVPSISSLSPEGAAVGGAGFTLTVNGSGFLPSSVVAWEHSERPTTYISSTRLTAEISASDLTNVNTAFVEVVNFGFQYSNSVLFRVDEAQSSSITSRITVELPTNDLVYDSVSKRLFVSVPSSGGLQGNTVTAIDPATGKMLSSVFVGSEPGKLAVSDDGQFLYVGLDGAAAVRRYDIKNAAAGLQFSLGQDSFLGPYYVEDMEVLPGAPHSVAIARRNQGFSPKHEGVAIYDDGAQRPQVTQDHTGSNAIEFSASSSTLYGYNNETTEYGFRTLRVDSDGVAEISVVGNLISGFFLDIVYAAGRIYSTGGDVIDPAEGVKLGEFGARGSVRPDPANGKVFYLTASEVSDQSLVLRAFDLDTFRSFDSATLPNAAGETNGYSRLVRWGVDGLAFRTNERVTLLRSTLVQP